METIKRSNYFNFHQFLQPEKKSGVVHLCDHKCKITAMEKPGWVKRSGLRLKHAQPMEYEGGDEEAR